MIQRFTLEVPRTARVFFSGGESEPVREAWFLLHGYGQLAEPFLASLTALEQPARLLVAPEALSRFYLRRGTGEVGASWMTKEERALEIADTLRYLDRLAETFDARAGTRTLLGFSQGAATAARWAVLGRTLFARVLLWGCPLPPDLELLAHRARVLALRWVFVLGEHDTTIERAAVARDVGRLRELGASVEEHTFDGGHELDAGLLGRL